MKVECIIPKSNIRINRTNFELLFAYKNILNIPRIKPTNIISDIVLPATVVREGADERPVELVIVASEIVFTAGDNAL